MSLRVSDRVRFHVSQLAGLDVRLVSKLVAKGRARWTAYGVKLTGKGEPR
jgi:hypothetical protein